MWERSKGVLFETQPINCALKYRLSLDLGRTTERTHVHSVSASIISKRACVKLRDVHGWLEVGKCCTKIVTVTHSTYSIPICLDFLSAGSSGPLLSCLRNFRVVQLLTRQSQQGLRCKTLPR